MDLNAVEPKPRQWIQDMTWLNLVELSRLSTFANLLKDIPRKEKVGVAHFSRVNASYVHSHWNIVL